MSGAWIYQAFQETRYSPELGQYSTYGILASKKTSQGWEQIELLHDVTVSGQLAEHLVHLFNLYQLSHVHLKDVIEDMIP